MFAALSTLDAAAISKSNSLGTGDRTSRDPESTRRAQGRRARKCSYAIVTPNSVAAIRRVTDESVDSTRARTATAKSCPLSVNSHRYAGVCGPECQFRSLAPYAGVDGSATPCRSKYDGAPTTASRKSPVSGRAIMSWSITSPDWIPASYPSATISTRMLAPAARPNQKSR